MAYLPLGGASAFQVYEDTVISYMTRIFAPVILDVGGGTECCFSAFKPPGGRILCLDVSQQQLANNRDADELVLADATKEIPLPDASVDLIVSRAVIEHMESPQDFFRHSYRVLKPGGCCIHVFPCKLALFAIINRLLPQTLSRKILFYFKPDSREKGGFPAYYHKCYYTKIRKILMETGFHVKEIRHYYNQSVYFEFFFPFFLLSALYEIITLPIKNLTPFLLVVVQKPENCNTPRYCAAINNI
jgi:ubiquinone/menaquinone biosynthesis C-methylase UbiE